MKRVLSIILSFCLLTGMLPAMTFASGGAPMITVQPQDVAVRNGENAVYSVTAIGENLTYQWYSHIGYDYDYAIGSDSANYTGADTDTLTVLSVCNTEGNYDCYYSGAQYYCVISNAYGVVTSDIVSYTVSDHASEYAYDQDEHWRLCGCNETYESHTDAEKDGYCDICKELFGHPFVDVTDPEAWYYHAAAYSRRRGYFKGDPSGKFNGNSAITRAEAVTVLCRALRNLDTRIDSMSEEEFRLFIETQAAENGSDKVVTFTDVSGTWYERYAVALANFGFLTGYEDGTFQGDRLITRQEIAAVMYRFTAYVEADFGSSFTFGPSVSGYRDAENIAPWAKVYVAWAAETGLFQGDHVGNFNPAENATRAEFAQLLVRFDTARYN